MRGFKEYYNDNGIITTVKNIPDSVPNLLRMKKIYDKHVSFFQQ
jgi:hypothetical protein